MSIRASSSFKTTPSTRRRSAISSGRMISIHRFIVSTTVNVGCVTWSSAFACTTGDALARKRNFEPRIAVGIFGSNFSKTLSCVSIVWRVFQSDS